MNLEEDTRQEQKNPYDLWCTCGHCGSGSITYNDELEVMNCLDCGHTEEC